MGEAEALLNSLTENVAHHEHPVTDTGSHFIIDPETREITNETRKHYIMQGDHNSQVYTFELPRYIDGHDMFMCNKVKIHFNNIAEDEPTENADVADATPLELNEDESAVICTWSIERNATQLVGILSFGVEYQCVTNDGEVVYEFNTDIYSNVHVKASRDNSEKAISEYSNILEQWRARIFGAGDSVMANIDSIADEQITAIHQQGATQKDILESTGNTQRDAIVAKGAEVLDTIPEDYTATHRMAEESVRSKANAIVCEASGKSIVVTDSSDDHLRGLKLFGKTTQATTTGAQLANLPDGEIELGGILWTCHGGVVTAKGTCNAESSSTGVSIHHNLTGMIGTYYVSGNSEPVKVYVRIKENGTERWFNNGPVTLDGTEDDVLFYMQVAGVGTTVDTTLYPMLNAGDKPLPWEPYTGGKPSPNPDYPQELVSIEPTVEMYGKNLIEFDHGYNRLASTVGTVIEVFENGIIAQGAAGTVPGSQRYSNGWYQIYYKKPFRLAVGQTVTASLDYTVLENPYSTTDDIAFMICPMNGSTNITGAVKRPADGVKTRLSYTITALEDDVYHISIGLNSCKVRIENIQLEFGETATNFEPYKPIQTLSLAQSLPGIPVSSGGNYTDSEGQQWICDEIDFERDMYVQRVYMDVITVEKINSVDNAYVQSGGSIAYFVPTYQHMQNDNECIVMSDWCISIPCKDRNTRTDEYRCYAPASDPNVITLRYPVSAGEKTLGEARSYFDGRSVMYALREPIETPIDGTAMAAFKALHTNCPNTTILNDAGAWMSVKYNADTKTYVENPKVLKLVDSSTGVVYELKIVDGLIVANPV